MHWIREVFEKDELTIDYVKSEENESDIITKNIAEQLQQKFRKRLEHYDFMTNGTLLSNQLMVYTEIPLERLLNKIIQL